MNAGGVADDLAWWRAHREAGADPAELRARLERLQAWKAGHDRDRAHHPPPFLRMAWDAVFGDENEQVDAAIAEIEAALG
jgi:hypothetical protein